MLNMENRDWAECQLENTAKRAPQFNLHGEKRVKGKGGRKKEEEEKEEKGEKIENEKVKKVGERGKEKLEKQR